MDKAKFADCIANLASRGAGVPLSEAFAAAEVSEEQMQAILDHAEDMIDDAAKDRLLKQLDAVTKRKEARKQARVSE